MTYRVRIETSKGMGPHGYQQWEEIFTQIVEELKIEDVIAKVNGLILPEERKV